MCLIKVPVKSTVQDEKYVVTYYDLETTEEKNSLLERVAAEVKDDPSALLVTYHYENERRYLKEYYEQTQKEYGFGGLHSVPAIYRSSDGRETFGMVMIAFGKSGPKKRFDGEGQVIIGKCGRNQFFVRPYDQRPEEYKIIEDYDECRQIVDSSEKMKMALEGKDSFV